MQFIKTHEPQCQANKEISSAEINSLKKKRKKSAPRKNSPSHYQEHTNNEMIPEFRWSSFDPRTTCLMFNGRRTVRDAQYQEDESWHIHLHHDDSLGTKSLKKLSKLLYFRVSWNRLVSAEFVCELSAASLACRTLSKPQLIVKGRDFRWEIGRL